MQSTVTQKKGKRPANQVNAEKPKKKTQDPAKKREKKAAADKKPSKKEKQVQNFVDEASKKDDGKIVKVTFSHSCLIN